MSASGTHAIPAGTAAAGARISLRLTIVILVLIAIAGAGVLVWSVSVQKEIATRQAQDFVRSAHQMTLAGLTALMIAGRSEDRAVFLDQIRESENILSLRVVRGEAVRRQYGAGTPAERALTPLDHRVLETGEAAFVTRAQTGREIMTAVLPAIAQRDYLGKNCLACHAVAEGTVLGAVAMEVSLDPVNAAVRDFLWRIALSALLILIPLILLIYKSLMRAVTRPLEAVTAGLNRIAAGEIDPKSRIDVRGTDEIAAAVAAFNRVIGKAYRMVESERIAADVFEHALEGILVTDRNGRILKVNPAFTRTTGYAPDEAIGKTPRLLQSGRHDLDFYVSFWHALKSAGAWEGEIWNRRKNGELYPERLNISSVRDEDGEIVYYIAIFSDITERKRREAIITHRAHHDSLTGLPNRALFTDRLEQALAAAHRHESSAIAVMFLDLDRFKLINDTLGHDAGDDLLQEVARRLCETVREMDTVARLGGDEFVIMLPEIRNAKNAEAVAQKALDAVGQPYRLRGTDVLVTPSIGISLYPGDGRDAATLVKSADVAMYQVKSRGRAGICFYTPALGERNASSRTIQRAASN